MPTNEYNISKAFKRIENDLMDSMMRNLKRHQAEETELGFEWEQWQALQLKELERYRKENAKLFQDDFKQINDKVEAMFKATCKDAQAKQENYILEQIKKGDFTPTQVKDTQFFNLNDDKLNILIERTKADFTRGEYAMLRKADDVYRQTIFDAQVYANVTNDYAKAVDMATHDFLAKGIQCITYKNGAKHTMEDYAEMCVRTGNKRAYLMGEGNAHDKYGVHTVRVNKRTQACPKCVGFLGRVLVDDVYGGGTRTEALKLQVPTLSDAIQAGFLHPNCKDIYSLYIDGVSRPATPWTKDEIEQIVGDYNTEQDLKHAEDMVESYNRMAKYALSPENQARYQARADGWQGRVDILKGIKPIPPVIPPIKPTTTVTQPPVIEPKPIEVEEDQEAIIRNSIKDAKDEVQKLEAERKQKEDKLSFVNNAKMQWASLVRKNETTIDAINKEIDFYFNLNNLGLYADDIDRLNYIKLHHSEFLGGTITEEAELNKQIKQLKKQEKTARTTVSDRYTELEQIIGTPNVTKLSLYGDKNTQAIKWLLDDAPQACRDIWNHFADEFNILSKSGGKRGYYSPSRNGVSLSISRASKGTTYQTPYQLVFHEFGHNIDWELNRKFGNKNPMQSFTANYKGGVFGKTIQQEAEEAIEKYAKANNIYTLPNKGTVVVEADKMVKQGLIRADEKAEWIRNKLQEQTIDRAEAEKQFCNYIKNKYSLLQRTDISDMFESIMQYETYPFGVGHGKKYWGAKGVSYKPCGQEAFAEMYSAMIANPESWAVIQDYFPESVKIFNEILEVTKL